MMSETKSALLLVGSPKGEISTSASLGNYLLQLLAEADFKTAKAIIHRFVIRSEKVEELLSMVNNADLIILSFPLYVDSLPAPVIKAMELIRDNRNEGQRKTQDFIAISNCGFPESSQIEVALEICKNFAEEVNFNWRGGLALGGGGAVNGRPIEERGGMLRNVIKGLEITAEHLSKGEDIPNKAIELVSKSIIPSGMYKMMGNLGWRIQARRYGVLKRMKDQPDLN
jgi:multimeric flavodoxin WrbA